MNKYMIDQHNSVVSPEDTTYFLGDFCFTSGWRDVENILKKMNGQKILILGNHDRLNVFDYVEAGFTSVHTSLMLEDFLLIHDPAVAGVLRDIKVIHGHIHGLRLRVGRNTWNVSVEMQDYTPIDFEYIKENW
jgi:calcineurin-like phosphoesterase family protein